MNNSEHSDSNNADHSHSDEAKDRGCVLLVDDHDSVRRMLSLALEIAGFNVAAAGTQQQVQRRLADTRPDALVLNLQRSEADGLEVLRAIRARQDLSRVPIIFLAGSDSDDLRGQAIRAGADWFGVRPLAIAELEQRIRQLIRHGRAPLKLIATCARPIRSRRLKPTAY